MLMVSIFVDDASIYGRYRKDIDAIIEYLKQHFNLVVKGLLSMFLGTHYIVKKDFIIMSATHKIFEPKDLFYPDEEGVFFKDVELYMSIIGSFLFIARLARPDILFAVIQLSRFASNPLTIHYKAAIKIIQYLYNTKDIILKFKTPQFV